MTVIDEIPGASAWDEEVYEAFKSHIGKEGQLLEEYERLADATGSPDVAYLVGLILEDEHRHHRVFEELAATFREVVQLESAPHEVPDIPLRRAQSETLRKLTNQLLKLEREDDRQLRQLRRTLRPVADTTLWPLLIEIMQLDTKKHMLILKHINEIAGGLFG